MESYDVIYHDRNVYDIKVANIVSDYVDLTNKLIKLAKDNSLPENSINEILNKQTKKSRSRTGQRRHYEDLLEGRFNINNVIHLERGNDTNAISNKAFDLSLETIKQLRENGYNETIRNLTKQSH